MFSLRPIFHRSVISMAFLLCLFHIDTYAQPFSTSEERLVPADQGALIIPEAAFEKALEESHYDQVDLSIKNQAAALAAVANDPRTFAITGKRQVSDRPVPFSGTLFIVVREPLSADSSDIVRSTDYYVAAVELSGSSPWLATSASFVTRPSRDISGGRCCGPPTICVQSPVIPQTPPQPPPEGPCNPRGTNFCPSSGIGVTKNPGTQAARQQNGLPNVGLKLFPPKSVDVNVPSHQSTGPTVFESCTNALDSSCTQAKYKPDCQLGDPGYTLGTDKSADVGSGSTNCAGSSPAHTVFIRDVPKVCTIISGWENLPAGCGGYCPSCSAISSQPSARFNGLSPNCLFANYGPESNVCKTSLELEAQKAVNNGAMAAKVCVNPANCTGQLCEPTARGGREVCTTCTNGQCSQYATQPKIDPRAAANSTNDNNEDSEKNSEETDVRWEVDFEPETVIGVVKKPTPPTPPAPDPHAEVDPKDPVPPPNDQPASPPSKPRWQPESITERLTDFFFPEKKGDPVSLIDGSFFISQTDMSFDGPRRSLEFRRTYSSNSRTRSTLGSNWSHNWDVWIQPLRVDTTPAWALPYCAESENATTCLLLHDGSGGTRLFFFDLQSRLFMPQAGSTDTVATTMDGGWALRKSDGLELYFNEQGYLVNERDRFGNGFSITYERTPLFEMYDYYCNADALALRNETKYSRRCAVLAYLMDDAGRPDPGDPAWRVTAADYEGVKGTRPSGRLEYARQYFTRLLRLGPTLQSAYGGTRLRPTTVIDDLGRTLEFSYYQAPPVIGGSSARSPVYDFASTPHSELLDTVRGPEGVSVKFTYARPSNYVPALNESFLVRVHREDSPSGQDLEAGAKRSIEYQYQWPQGPVPSYDSGKFAETIFAKYLAFYETFVGCAFQGQVCIGNFTPAEFASGNAENLATRERNAYISDVADNIIQVINNGMTESETRYTVDPLSPVFDHVTAQRYGSSQTRQDATLIAADQPTDNWQTKLPKATLNYQSAGPSRLAQSPDPTGDLTETSGFLPEEIRQRYPLETASAAPQDEIIAPLAGAGATGPGIRACNYVLMQERRKELPDYRPLFPYFEVQANERHPNFVSPLYRSRLACEQLAVAQLGDPTHNDLLSTLEPIRSTVLTTDHRFSRILGHRQVIAANVNRICSWTSMVDRDGDSHYYGLNYRGQVLVDAVKERTSGQFIFSERLVNADGLVLQERRPTRGPQPWQPIDGSTTYTYDEIDPSGNNGWNEWLPVYWSRRANLLRVEHHAAGLGVVDDRRSSGQGWTASLGRFQRFNYEPLFNQVKAIETGSVELLPNAAGRLVSTDVPHERIDYVFDYQELESVSALKPVLDHLKPWGFGWKENAPGSPGYDLQVIAAWQLPMTFYGKDLNGDGELGFGYGTQAFEGARGVPILASRGPVNGSGHPQVSSFVWAPHGLPAVVRGPDNTMTVFEYYSVGSSAIPPAVIYGESREPNDNEVSIGFRGLLGRVRNKQFPNTYAATDGPPDKPCATLAGPYQWILPETCSNTPRAELQALGLPKEAIDLILSSVTIGSNDRWLTTAFSYSQIGKPRYSWAEGKQTHVVRDTDGRVRIMSNPVGTKTEHSYTSQGLPEKTLTVDSLGKILNQTFRQFDDEGRPIYTCSAQEANGCVPLGAPELPQGVVQRYSYWPEGTLRTITDPEGLTATFDYNERKLPTSRTLFHPSFGSTSPRVVTYEYNLDGDLLVTHFGTAKSPFGGLSNTKEYDGLRRVKTIKNTRGYRWQVAYSNRDLLTGYKRDDMPYGLPSTAAPSWETELEYDDFGRILRQVDNGTLTSRFARTERGLVYALSEVGKGTSYTTYDLSGNAVWTRDGAGNESISTLQPTTNIHSTATIRKDAGRLLTTATVDHLNSVGLPVGRVQYGSGNEQRWSWKLDGGGLTLETLSPEGYLTIYERDLLGLPKTVSKQASATTPPRFNVTSLEYNKRGQLKQITDPAKQITELQYDPFGALKSRQAPGQPRASRSMSFDELGRVDEEQVGASRIKHVYDTRGDPVSELIFEHGTTFYPLAERSFDDLGRKRETRNFNYALSWLPIADRTVTQSLDYDSLGRVSKDGLQVAQGTPNDAIFTWSVIPPGVLQRKLEYAVGTSWRAWLEKYDQVGRLHRKEQLLPGGSTLGTSFDWLGNIYIGRAQDQVVGQSSPFRERREVDSFGRMVGWQYTAIDLNSNNAPVAQQEGVAYCGIQWLPGECGRSLQIGSALRDNMGRIASLKSAFGYPVFDAGALIQTTHPKPWRGYNYDPMGQLTRLWEHAGESGEVLTGSLLTHHISAGDIQTLGAGSDEWEYDREPTVGSTNEIRNVANNTERWSIVPPRGPGHQLQRFEVNGVAQSITYDAAGRVQTIGSRTYFYDPRGQLAGIVVDGAVVEYYAYDDMGRLAAVFTVHGSFATLTSAFLYDGIQPIAAYGAQNKPLWEATWGPGIDRLIKWDDIAGQTGDHVPLVDHRNSITAFWEPQGKRVTQTAEYTPEGRLWLKDAKGQTVCREGGSSQTCAGPDGAPFGFVSAWRSPLSGLVYMRSRWYSPEIGQFISQDPLGYRDSYNPYAYAGFDPINGWDPLGMETKSLASTGSASVAAGGLGTHTPIGDPSKFIPFKGIPTSPVTKIPRGPITPPSGGPGPGGPGGGFSSLLRFFGAGTAADLGWMLGRSLGLVAFLIPGNIGDDCTTGCGSPPQIAPSAPQRGPVSEPEEELIPKFGPGVEISIPKQDPNPTGPQLTEEPDTDLLPMQAAKKTMEDHHIFTNKHQAWREVFTELLLPYGLTLDDPLNIERLPHGGRHPNAYHMYMYVRLLATVEGIQDPSAKLLSPEERLKLEIDDIVLDIILDPDILNRKGWKD